jgi:hypothetical protein
MQEPQLGRTEKGAIVTEALTVIEREELTTFESRIESGLKTFREVGAALLAIRDGRLYRSEHGTFEAYCQERWGFSRMRASQLISAAEVVENVNHGLQIDATPNERQARPLAALPPDRQPEAWKAATEKAQTEGRKVTARDVTEEVTRIKKEVTIDPLSGRVDAPEISIEDEKNAEPPNLAGLKRYWRNANKRERKAFLQWVKEEGEGNE